MSEKKSLPHAQRMNIHISPWSLLHVVILILGLWLLYIIRDILMILFFSIILAAAIDPFVDRMQERKIPRVLGILLIYILLLGLFLLVVSLMIPAVVIQFQELLNNLPLYISQLSSGFQSVEYYVTQYGLAEEIRSAIRTISGQVASNGGVFSIVSGFFGGIFSFVLIFVITFYMLIQENAIKKAFRFLAPPQYQPYLIQLLVRIQDKIGLWLRGQLVLSFIVGLMSYIGLFLVGMPYALVLALIAGIAELVPYVGPVLGAIPAIFLAFTISPMLAIIVLVLYVVIQQLENNLLVPKIMQKAIGLNPLISITALLIGAKVAGILGTLIAIPVATALSVVLADVFHEREESFFDMNHGQ